MFELLFGLAGGIVSYSVVGSSIIYRQAGATSRAVAILTSALCVGVAVVWSVAALLPPAWPGVVGGVVAAVSLLVLSTLRSGNLSPGGVDNAGSVGNIAM